MAAEPSSGNLIVPFLPPQLAAEAEAVMLERGAILYEEGDTPPFGYFPSHGTVISLVRSTADGSMVEAGVVGSEGMASIHNVIVDQRPVRNRAIAQLGGRATRVPAEAVRECFLADASFRDSILVYTSYFLEQVTQNTVCNRLHLTEQRLAKWLLAMRDRTDSDELNLTHEFLSHMLGIHRPGVTIAINELEVDALITHGRQRLVIRDHDGLVRRACECYGSMREAYGELRAALPRVERAQASLAS